MKNPKRIAKKIIESISPLRNDSKILTGIIFIKVSPKDSFAIPNSSTCFDRPRSAPIPG